MKTLFKKIPFLLIIFLILLIFGFNITGIASETNDDQFSIDQTKFANAKNQQEMNEVTYQEYQRADKKTGDRG